MIICDLCGEAKDCLQKEIEGKEYDICSECWNPFAQKLRGKGRVKSRETVFLPARGWSKNEKMKSRRRYQESRLRFGAQWIGLINEPCNEPGASVPPVGTMFVFRSGSSKRKRTRRRR